MADENSKVNLHDNEDEFEEHEIEQEIEVDSQPKKDNDENEEFPDWVSGKRTSSSGRKRVKKRIKIKKKIKVRKKSSTRKYKKLIERLIWILVILGFIAALVVLVNELDINDAKYKKKKSFRSESVFQKDIIRT
jgi:hypothetical protein